LSTKATQTDLFCRAAKNLDCEQIKSAFFLFCHSAKTMESTDKSNSNQLYLVLAPNALYLLRKNLILLLRSEKLANCEQAQYFVPRSKTFGIDQQKKLRLVVFCSAAERKV
jgi:hypothetical protein